MAKNLVEVVEMMRDGFNVEMMAEILDCSVGRVNELRRQPVEGQVYHAADINVDAILAFAEKHEINLEEKVDELIKACEAKKVRKEEEQTLKVGDKTKYGVISEIQKIGNSFVYLIKTETGYTVKSKKELVA